MVGRPLVEKHPVPGVGQGKHYIWPKLSCGAHKCTEIRFAAVQIRIAIKQEYVRKNRSERVDDAKRIRPIIASVILTRWNGDDQSYRIIRCMQIHRVSPV